MRYGTVFGNSDTDERREISRKTVFCVLDDSFVLCMEIQIGKRGGYMRETEGRGEGTTVLDESLLVIFISTHIRKRERKKGLWYMMVWGR